MHPIRKLNIKAMRIILIALFCLVVQNTHTQDTSLINYFITYDQVLPELIEMVKYRSLPVICYDYQTNNISSGTGVVINSKTRILILTCEHVVALKDTVYPNKTLRYKSNNSVFLNKVIF